MCEQLGMGSRHVKVVFLNGDGTFAPVLHGIKDVRETTRGLASGDPHANEISDFSEAVAGVSATPCGAPLVDVS